MKALCDEWIEQLLKQRRIVELAIAGARRFIAAEDAGRYRDALGIPPPPGLPEAFLECMSDPLGDLVARFARTHGPFHAIDAAGRLGIGTAPIQATLQKLENAGRVVEGEFRPGGAGREWCDAGVLRALRQKSLARLRHEVEPVEQAALGRLYLAWQGIKIDDRRLTIDDRGPHVIVHRPSSIVQRPGALLDVIERLQGAAIPASVLESQVLPARLPGYDPHTLDSVMASGSVIWVGCESLGQHDGRVALYLAEHAPMLLDRKDREPECAIKDDIHQRIRSHLQARGASFFPQILLAVDGFAPEVVEALWDLVWAGEITNDTLQPLRAYMNPRRLNRNRAAYGRREPSRPRYGRHVSPILSASPRRVSPIMREIPPESAGRWSLVSSVVVGEPTATERLAARTQQLLERYGVLTREAVQAEGIEGGFSAIYGVLKAMEESGRVRRGYFVAGRGATQFAVAGAVDRLRTLREPPEQMESVLLAATDPANPYGAALPWPEREEGRRPMRMAGAIVILVDGALAAWMGRGERHLLTFVEQVEERDPDAVRCEIGRVLAAEIGSGKRRAVFVEEVDGRPTADSPMAPALLEAGFMRTSHGFLKRI